VVVRSFNQNGNKNDINHEEKPKHTKVKIEAGQGLINDHQILQTSHIPNKTMVWSFFIIKIPYT
jgi:hypothetical protein